MENQGSPECNNPVQFVRRAFRQFKNPPQPHMCIQDSIKGTSEKLFINVLGWQKIANPKQYSDPIPLYGGMQVPQGCGPNRIQKQPPLLVFAVMVNPDILKANGKNAKSPSDREALVSLLCDFVEAMNPGLVLARDPVILRDRDLAGELKDVWLAVQNKREREKGMNQDVMYKVYDIDGIGNEDTSDENNTTNHSNDRDDGGSHTKMQNGDKKSSKQNLMNAGQKSEFDSDTNNCRTKCKAESAKIVTNGKAHYDFFPVFDNKPANGDEKNDVEKKSVDENSKVIVDPMQKLVLHSTDNKVCDNNTSALSSLGS